MFKVTLGKVLPIFHWTNAMLSLKMCSHVQLLRQARFVSNPVGVV